MRVTILGSGTAVPSSERFPASVLVQASGTSLLVDAGPGSLRRLAATGLGLEQLDAVLLTHFHTDHCADVAALLFALRNPRYQGRPPLRLLAHEGLRGWLDHLTAAWPWLAPKGYELSVEEIAPGEHRLGAVQITAHPIEHTAESLAYRLTAGARSVAISGDADVCGGLVEVARDADLFVCESAFPDDHRTQGHLTPSLAAEAATHAQARHLCLTHFYPECEGHDLRAQARAHYQGPLTLATDLLRFEL